MCAFNPPALLQRQNIRQYLKKNVTAEACCAFQPRYYIHTEHKRSAHVQLELKMCLHFNFVLSIINMQTQFSEMHLLYSVQHIQGHSSAAITEQFPALVSLPISHSEP